MKQITGFPAKMEFTPIPNYFLATLLPQINDISELKTTIHILGALYQKRGYPRLVTLSEILASKSLITSFSGAKEPPDHVLRQALEMTISRGTFLHLSVDKDGRSENIYLLNTAANRQIITNIQSGELSLPGLKVDKAKIYIELTEPSDIFTLYEQNIGMLTPIIADELSDAEKLYPVSWIKDAIKEAVAHNKRNWRYIAAILESWTTEGKSDGTYRRSSKRKEDPDKYIKGKYGHMVWR